MVDYDLSLFQTLGVTDKPSVTISLICELCQNYYICDADVILAD